MGGFAGLTFFLDRYFVLQSRFVHNYFVLQS